MQQQNRSAPFTWLVHLRQVPPPEKCAATEQELYQQNRSTPFTWLVHLRQVHPLRENQSRTSHGFHRCAQIFLAGIPSYENSHRLHGCAQIRRQKRNLKICEWNLWENILRQSFLWVLRILWEDMHDCSVGAAGTAAPPERTPIKNLPRISQMRTDISCCDILLRKLPQIARMCTD